MTLNVFTDPASLPSLYEQGGSRGRLGRRTSALHRAKIHGDNVPDQICALIEATMVLPPNATIIDIGCGRGSTTLALAERFPRTHVVAIDASAAMLHDARRKVTGSGHRAGFIRADFHQLPLADGTVAAAAAAFCLYHAPAPSVVIGEIARTLQPDGAAVLVTKSPDSYSELDDLMVRTGLDPEVADRPSLYAAAHSGNLPDLADTCLQVNEVTHEQHRFRFTGLNHVAEYLVTSPKYHLPVGLAEPKVLAAALRAHVPDEPVTATSTVTYVLGHLRRP